MPEGKKQSSVEFVKKAHMILTTIFSVCLILGIFGFISQDFILTVFFSTYVGLIMLLSFCLGAGTFFYYYAKKISGYKILSLLNAILIVSFFSMGAFFDNATLSMLFIIFLIMLIFYALYLKWKK